MKDIKTTLLIVGAGFLLILVLIGFLLFQSTKQNPNPSITPTIFLRPSATPFFVSPTVGEEEGPTPTIDPPLSGTGFSDDLGLTEEEQKVINESYELQTKVPISLSQFYLTYESQQVKFYVTIYDPYNENLLYFRNWIKTNGYESIPDEKFVIVRGTK